MVTIYFAEQALTAEVAAGTTILEAARAHSIIIESPCNGIGTCGKCKVLVKDFAAGSIVAEKSHHQLSEEEIAAGYVLACQTKVYGDITVVFGSTETQNKTLKIVSEGQSFAYAIEQWLTKVYRDGKTALYREGVLVGYEDGDTTDKIYGIAIDIGTTTLVMALIDMKTGEEITSISALNPQSLHAQDVITRIHLASEPEGLALLYQTIVAEFNQTIECMERETGISSRYYYEVVYSGNTTMIHLACNVNPVSLGQFPYTAQLKGGNTVPATDLRISPFGRIYLPPIISAYVGPDITSGVLASQLDKKPGTTLFIDIGTNGEMVLATDGKLAATSTAAGPAFEGMNITCGMRAGNGALELYQIADQDAACPVQTHVIGDVAAAGICGSGLLDIMGELVRVGVIGKNGRFVKPDSGKFPVGLRQFFGEQDGKTIFYVAPAVYVNQSDIRQVQLAKGAIRAGIEMLMQQLQIDPETVDVVEIAGSFGYHLRESSLLDIGLLPPAFQGKVKFVGNTSKSGGKAFLLNLSLREEIQKVVADIAGVELSKDPAFEKVFVKALTF